VLPSESVLERSSFNVFGSSANSFVSAKNIRTSSSFSRKSEIAG
jgi:hypothetical protein